MVGPVGGRSLERGALRRLDGREGRPLAVEVDEIQLREDPHQTAGERRGPGLRTLAPEQCLAGLPTGGPGRGGRSPIDEYLSQSLAQVHPTPGASSLARTDGRAPVPPEYLCKETGPT